MARFVIKTLVNPTDEDFTDKWDGEEYTVPAHGELQVPDFIAYHFCGENSTDKERALLRRGDGGQLRGDKKLGVTVYIKDDSAEDAEKEMLVEDGKVIGPVSKSKKKQ